MTRIAIHRETIAELKGEPSPSELKGEPSPSELKGEPSPSGLVPGDVEERRDPAVVVYIDDVLHPVDTMLMEARGEIVTMEEGEARTLVEGARHVRERFADIAERLVPSQQQARFVKKYRVEKRYSWRSLAYLCFQMWKPRDPHDQWQPAHNQLMGIALCERAQELLGESWTDC